MLSSNELKILKEGGIGVMPTDTLLGLVGSARNQRTVQRIYKVRLRNPKKPFIILISNVKDMLEFKVDEEVLKKIKMIDWPAGLTIIIPLKEKSELTYLHRGTKKLAFRMPKNEAMRKLLQKTGPLVAPSANTEGKPSAQNIKEAKEYFEEKVDFYVSGKVKKTQSSIIEWIEDGFKIVRTGAISEARLRKLKLIG